MGSFKHEEQITNLIESNSELRSIMHPIGNTYMPSGLIDPEILLLTCYIRKKWNYEILDKDEEDFHEEVFAYLGGGDYFMAFNEGMKDGLLGLRNVYNDSMMTYRKIPTISGNKGYEALQKVLGKMSGQKTRLILAGTKFSSRMGFQEFLEDSFNEGNIDLVDSYIDSRTLHFFEQLGGRKVEKFRILTSHINENRFLDNLAEFKKEVNIDIEVRTNQDIHDRFLILGNEAWLLGSSLKDLGNKDTAISNINSVIASLKDLFEMRWKESDLLK